MSKEFSKQPLGHYKTLQDLFKWKARNSPFQPLHNLATHYLNRLWAVPLLPKIYYFSTKTQRTKRLFVSDEEQSRGRQTQQEGDIWPSALEMCCYWSGGHQLMGGSCGALVISCCFLWTSWLEGFRKHLHWMLQSELFLIFAVRCSC